MNYLRHLRTTLLAFCALPGLLAAQVLDYTTLPNSPAYESAAEPLRNAPARDYTFNDATLASVFKSLAQEAGISFFSLPTDSKEGSQLVTFTLHCSPFLALETLTRANGIALIYERGVWHLRPQNDVTLIGVVYQITYNSRELVTSQSAGGNLGVAGGGFGAGGGGGQVTTSVDLQGTTQAFKTEPSKLLDDIKELLGIPVGAQAIMGGSTSVDALAGGLGGASTIILPSNLASAPLEAENKAKDSIANGAKVIWNSDSNTLYVVGTRQQHQWIEGYLASSDKPQDQIAIEVKFFEVSRDPRREFGIDWTDTLGEGYNITLTDAPAANGQPNVPGIDGPLDLNRILDYRPPSTAILSFQDVQFQIDALYNDLNTKSVSYPRMVTTNNREVMIRSVINQPVLAGNSSTSLGAGATTTQSISYLPIGTVLNVLPKRLGNGKVQLNIALTISSIIGTQVIGGNPYPIASSRVYNAPVEVDEGYTVAIGGLDEATWQQDELGIPALRKLPVLGYAFKTKSERRERKSLMIFITPDVIDTKDGGLPDEPKNIRRGTPHDPAPPVIFPDGALVSSPDEFPGMFISLDHELDLFDAELDDHRIEKHHKDRMRQLEAALNTTRARIGDYLVEFPHRQSEFMTYDAELNTFLTRLKKIQKRTTWTIF